MSITIMTSPIRFLFVTYRMSGFRGYFCCFGGILIMLPIGTLYSASNMVPYIVSYCRYKGTDPTLTYQTASFILAVSNLGVGLSMWAGGYLERRLGVRLATFIGVVVFNISIFASAWAVRVSFYFLLLTYGFLFGVGIGLAYVPPLVCVMKWMPRRKGVVNGLLLSGFGAGSLIFNIIQTVFINPANLSPDVFTDGMGADQRYYTQDSILDRVPFVFILQGIIFSIMQIIGIMLLGDPPNLNKRSRRYAIRRKDKRELNEKSSIVMNERPLASSGDDNDGPVNDKGSAAVGSGYEDLPSPSASSASEASPERTGSAMPMSINAPSTSASTSKSTSASTSASPSGPQLMGDRDLRWSGRTLSPKELFNDPFFWQLVVAMFLDGVAILYIASLYKAFGQTFIADDLFLAVVGSCSSIFNALGRIFWGHIADRFAFKISFMIVSCILAALTFTFGLSFYGDKVMFFIWVAGIFFSIGGVFSIAPTATSRAFGSDFVGINYGFVFLMGISIPSIIAAFTQQLLLRFLSWDVLFIIVGAFPAFGMIISMFFNIKTPNGDDI